MNELVKLIYLLQITRIQPQYGYNVFGGNQRLNNIAEHQYLVAVIAWQLAQMAKDAGANINIQKTIEFGLIHDLGELFGGDVGISYSSANPEARKYAKAFESENQKFLANYFGKQREYFEELSQEILDAKSDEALIAKIADYVELTAYLQFIEKFPERDLSLLSPKIQEKVEAMNDPVARRTMKEFTDKWIEETKSFTTFYSKVRDIFDS